MIRSMLFAVAAIASATGVAAQPLPAARLGETAEITVTSNWENRRSLSSGSGSSSHRLIERVIAVDGDAIVLEYDLPPGATPQVRAASWQFPARIRKAPGEHPTLLNADELQARSDTWLEATGFERERCGKWFFTWTAMKIECDPRSVLGVISDFDLWTGRLEPGVMHALPGTSGPAPLTAVSTGTAGTILEARFQIDPDGVRAEGVGAALILATLTGDTSQTREALTAEWQAKDISGTRTVTYELDRTGAVLRRTVVTTVRTTTATDVETATSTHITERHVITPATGQASP